MNQPAKQRLRIDPSDPKWRVQARALHRRTFIGEGAMVAFPLCFPGVTTPIPADESRIAALDEGEEGTVYGVTKGRRSHVFFASFRFTTGIVLDLGVPDETAQCCALCCGSERMLVAMNDAGGGRLVTRALQGMPGDLLQEWSFMPHPFEPVADGTLGAPLLDLAPSGSRDAAVGLTAKEVFLFDFAANRIVDRHALPGAGRLLAHRGAVFGFDGAHALWRYDVARRALQRQAVPLPPGDWAPATARWATDRARQTAYVADAAGRLFALAGEKELREAGQSPLAPVLTMAVTHDGRLFGFAGDGLARYFSREPRSGAVTELGTAVSVLERRRYGYAFAAAAVGIDGEIFFGEDDELAHLWIYFPSVRA